MCDVEYFRIITALKWDFFSYHILNRLLNSFCSSKEA